MSTGFELTADFDKVVNGAIRVEGLRHRCHQAHGKVNCMRGCAKKFSSGIVPFGDVFHFLDFRSPESAVANSALVPCLLN